MSTINLRKHELLECAARVRALDASDLAAKFQAVWYEASAGNRVCLRCNPRTGESWTTETVGAECGTDEYFSEHGAASITTLHSSQRDHWEPGPDDGFEWEDCAAGVESDYITDGNGAWMCSASAERDARRLGIDPEEVDGDLLDHMVTQHGWHYFRVSYTPVDPDLSEIVELIETAIEQLADDIEAEAAD